MGNEWPLVKFSDLLSEPVRNGIYKKKEFHGRGARIVNMGELFGHPRLFDIEMKRVKLTEQDKLNCLLSRGDLLFARRSLTAEGAGKCSIVKEANEETTFESSIIRARPDQNKANSEYLYYYFSSPYGKALMRSIMRQVAVAGITGTDLKQLKIPTPALGTQESIAHILGTLDDKIELNHRMNETLESMARALFKSWFVDFDPVIDNALAAGNSPTVQDLIDQDVLRMGDGYRAKRTELADVGLPFVRAGNLHAGGFDFSDAELLCEDSCAKAGEKNSRPYDIAFTSKGTVGRMTMVTPKTQPFVYSPQVCWWRVIDQSRLDAHVLYRWMESTEFMHQVAMVKGNTDMADYVSLRDQRAMHVNLPPIEAQRSLAQELNAIDHKMAGNREQSETLTKLRDALLPKLLSGELRIPDAEKLVANSP